MQSRRQFLTTAGAGLVTTLSLSQILAACSSDDESSSGNGGGDDSLPPSTTSTTGAVEGGYGPLQSAGPDLRLPEGFRYVKIDEVGSTMTDGFAIPGAHDGMAAFAGATASQVVLVRNHEIEGSGDPIGGAAAAYDGTGPGGVTISVFDTSTEQVVQNHLALNGTTSNCAGGRTPRDSWLSCEETTEGSDAGFEQAHGYVFEVPASATGPVEPVALTGLGRFVHEGTATDPETGVVYLTEDNGDPGDGLYRFVPSDPDDLTKPGQLQMLAVRGEPEYDTVTGQEVGRAMDVEWVDIAEPDPSDAESDPAAVYGQGIEGGAARFIGLEGVSFLDGRLVVSSSEGGDEEIGQVWELTPDGDGGSLVLLYESTDGGVLDGPDNLIITPRGGVVLCEDGDGADVDGGTSFVRGLTPAGQVFDFAEVTAPLDLGVYDPEEFPDGGEGRSETAGATWSPDGRWLFLNIQYPGATYAITGPWERGAL